MVSQSARKKILYVITKANFGGAQRYVYDLATNMVEFRHDVAVAMGGKGALTDELESVGVRTIILERLGRDINILDDIAIFFKLLKLFRAKQPAVVHLNSSKIGGLGALAARIARVPRIVFTAHGWAWNEQRSAWQKAVIKILSWITIMLCHRVITVSEYDGAQGRALPFASKKIAVIHNGVSKIDFKKRGTARAELLGADVADKHKNALWVGAIAELHKNKGLEYAVKAIASSTKTILVIIGEGEERARLEALVKNENLKDRVLLVGQREHASVFLPAFNIFILPSIKEGLPYAILEAGLAGLPVIATAVGGVPEIIDDMESGILVQHKNPAEIAKALAYMAENKEKTAEFGPALKQKVTKDFSTSSMIEQTVDIYEIWYNKK